MSEPGTKRILQLLVRVEDSFDFHEDADREFFLDELRSLVDESDRLRAMTEVLGLREVSTHYPEMVSEWVGEHDRGNHKEDDHRAKSSRAACYRMVSNAHADNLAALEENLAAMLAVKPEAR